MRNDGRHDLVCSKYERKAKKSVATKNIEEAGIDVGVASECLLHTIISATSSNKEKATAVH